MAEAPQWARVRGDVNVRLRRGAWYEVVSITPEQAVVDVNEQQLAVDRSFLQIVPLRPQRWSVVPRPADAVNLPVSWGATYGVCPTCRHRVPLRGQPTEMRCPKCNGVFPVAWDDPY